MSLRWLCIMAVVMLSLVIIATSASAECAWVLWVESPRQSNQWSLPTKYQFIFDSKKKCERVADYALNSKVEQLARFMREG